MHVPMRLILLPLLHRIQRPLLILRLFLGLVRLERLAELPVLLLLAAFFHGRDLLLLEQQAVLDLY